MGAAWLLQEWLDVRCPTVTDGQLVFLSTTGNVLSDSRFDGRSATQERTTQLASSIFYI